jgi:hypothetical protein
MRKLIVWALTATLALAPTAPAYAEQARRGRAFFNPGTDLSTPERYAQEIEKCATDNTASRLSCDMLVSSFNAAFNDIDDVRNYRELAEYFRLETEVRPCPQVVTPVAYVIGDKVGYSERELRENCFFDTNAQRFISSAGCGQWTPNLSSARNAASVSQPPPAPSTPDTLGRERNEGLVLPPQNFEARETEGRGFLEKHKGKLLTAGAVAGGLALLGLLLRSKQEVNQCVSVVIGAPTVRECR